MAILQEYSPLHPTGPDTPPPPEQSARPDSGEKKKKWPVRTRRTLGALVTTAVLAGGAAQVYENGTYTREAIVKEVETPAYPQYSDSTTLTITGFNTSRNQTRLSAESMSPALEQIGAVGWVAYPDKGVDVTAMKEKIVSYLDEHDYTTPNFYLSSMGGMVGLEIIADLIDDGVDAPDFIILDSTPASYADLLRPREVALMQTLNTPIMKSAYTSAQSIVERKETPLEAIESFWYNTFGSQDDPEKTTSKLLDSQVDYIKSFDVNAIAKRIPTSTKIFYIGGGEKDGTVDTISSHQRFAAAFHDRTVVYYDSRAPHASPIGDTEEYLAAFTPIIKEFQPASRIGRGDLDVDNSPAPWVKRPTTAATTSDEQYYQAAG